MKSILSILTACFVMAVNICTGQDSPALKYIKENSVKIDTNLDNLQDLSPLENMLAGRRIVGMGEATHGTHEFQIEKFRMLKFLVTKLGFKLFGIEANFTQCRQVNDYVMYGKGTAEKAIGEMQYWAWETKEVLQMIEWMRDYNQDKPLNHCITGS
jgi:erythromycin esterase